MSRPVEFIGLPSPFADPVVQMKLGRREFSRAARKDLWTQERKRQMQGFARVTGRTMLTLGPQHGLSQTYVFGPETYVVQMEAHDIEILMGMHLAHPKAFRVLDDIIVVRS